MARILLVEDNDMNRDMLVRRLERRGFQMSVALNGEEGVEKAQKDRPDLILMDISLPVMDGWQATRLIRQDDAIKAVPIIALTAHAMAGDRDKSLEAGCNDYDSKPIDFERLIAKINSLLNHLK